MLLYLVNLFIIGYLIFAWGWTSPPKTLLNRLLSYVSRPISWLGFSHSWSMFAPEPLYITRQLEIEFIFDDKSVLLWSAPTFHTMNVVQKFLTLRYRKYLGEIYRKHNRFLLEPLVGYLMRELDIDADELAEIQIYCTYKYVRSPRMNSIFTEPKRMLLSRIHDLRL